MEAWSPSVSATQEHQGGLLACTAWPVMPSRAFVSRKTWSPPWRGCRGAAISMAKPGDSSACVRQGCSNRPMITFGACVAWQPAGGRCNPCLGCRCQAGGGVMGFGEAHMGKPGPASRRLHSLGTDAHGLSMSGQSNSESQWLNYTPTTALCFGCSLHLLEECLAGFHWFFFYTWSASFIVNRRKKMWRS